jgi:hypothetical protein
MRQTNKLFWQFHKEMTCHYTLPSTAGQTAEWQRTQSVQERENTTIVLHKQNRALQCAKQQVTAVTNTFYDELTLRAAMSTFLITKIMMMSSS